MKKESSKTIYKFDNYEEMLNCIKMGEKVMRKSCSVMGLHFNETQMKYDAEKDCFYHDVFIGGTFSHTFTDSFKTAEDFKKESVASTYPLCNYYLVEES